MSERSSANRLRLLKLGAVLAFSAGASGCVTTVVALGASAASVAMSDKTAGSAIDDTADNAELKAKMINGKGFSLGDVQVTLSEGFVLLTGTAPTPQDRIEAERRAWTAAATRNVANEIVVGPRRSIGGAMADGVISTEVRSKYIRSNVKATNYTIQTNLKTVYLLGIARSRYELTDAVEEARTVRGVQKVVSYVRILDRPVIEKPETAAEAAARRAEEQGLKGGPQPEETLPYGPENPPPAQPDYAAYDQPAAADPYASATSDPYGPPAKSAAASAAASSYNAPSYAPPPGYSAPPAPQPSYAAQPPQTYDQSEYMQSRKTVSSYNSSSMQQQMQTDASMGGSPASGETLGPASDTFAGEVRPPVPEAPTMDMGLNAQNYAAPAQYMAPDVVAPAANAGPVMLTPP